MAFSTSDNGHKIKASSDFDAFVQWEGDQYIVTSPVGKDNLYIVFRMSEDCENPVRPKDGEVECFGSSKDYVEALDWMVTRAKKGNKAPAATKESAKAPEASGVKKKATTTRRPRGASKAKASA